MARRAEGHCELIHDPAGNTREFMFGPLTEQSLLLRVEPCATKRFHRRRHPHLEGSAAAEPCSRGKGRRNPYVAAWNLPPEPGEPRHDAAGIGRPRASVVGGHERTLQVYPHLRCPGPVRGKDHPPVGAGRDVEPDVRLDRHGQHETIVVVGMFTNQVDPTRGDDRKKSSMRGLLQHEMPLPAAAHSVVFHTPAHRQPSNGRGVSARSATSPWSPSAPRGGAHAITLEPFGTVVNLYGFQSVSSIIKSTCNLKAAGCWPDDALEPHR